ncbi:AAA-ATPase At3g28580 [Brachypodium distachyon]|uniref:AAA+ ATPase domain-containing protein n=1 Tax=Brachypodium distachyon TaxID=15368 RepID=A0A0Q3JS14_BRADI|nr:AAA-ATPase At3g28580 [Brachypodium distachyon]KQK20475.1 hypothetical protein BRADI_1g54750v3 [Brachypodium distachyon]|eukprot:XP_014757406.1 AAA-ATPase At3g28580 [Brachypodium distachyon]
MPPSKPESKALLVQRFAGLGSTLAGLMFVWSMVRPFLPRSVFMHYLGRFLKRYLRRALGFLDPCLTINIGEYDGGDRMRRGEVYDQARAYLSDRCSGRARSFWADLASRGSHAFVLTMGDREEVGDEFRGATVWWQHFMSGGRRGGEGDSGQFYQLVFHERHRELIVQSYLPHVCSEGQAIMARNRRRRLYTNSSTGDRHKSSWSYVLFEHPSTFDTLAMDPAKKRSIMDDLDAFRDGKEYYARIGKAWKRGYLLYGPPGTGKSTMIAAMANYLDYDIYDIELTSVATNIELRRLFIQTSGKSIVVLEDIDCSADLTGKRKKSSTPRAPADGVPADKKVTLSGLLNAVDGLWSACGGERIIIFTTNYVEELDPALIRHGRMDRHIEMSYCCFEAFKFLAKNYLGLDEHHLFDDIEALLQAAKITTADVAEQLMIKCADDDADSCLANLLKALALKVEENKLAETKIIKGKKVSEDE